MIARIRLAEKRNFLFCTRTVAILRCPDIDATAGKFLDISSRKDGRAIPRHADHVCSVLLHLVVQQCLFHHHMDAFVAVYGLSNPKVSGQRTQHIGVFSSKADLIDDPGDHVA